MRPLHLVTAFALVLATLGPATAAPPSAGHPILGIWRLTLPDGSCSEIYRFRGDGTTLVTSAEEVSESEFSIPAQPSPKGFYKLEDRLVKDNGKKDCAGQVMKVGTRVTHYVHFHPSGSMFVMCVAESLDVCIGPFRRMSGQET
ncbi:hypothetical protein KY495_16985 [Massilia sp. PAMC28688]|uniref:hypothetical protein n=1 Tax=Massilia sp. PAMC28688 TaxID=2861283 RepID=UPI001C638941|nr:hypothetical protein [Massilia sp. PAMC28688]QYF92434.1 hypothetical protein KY495_16985 [Massilia sp. PAMC28688]